jgi:glycosyltransferase involved in cell wall biosynthesis
MPEIVRFVNDQPFESEVIVVDNNSSDDTHAIAAQFSDEHAFIRVLTEPIQGKGAAVRRGMLNAGGNYFFMAAADLSMPIQEITKFIPPELDGYDVAIGSREVKGAVRYDEPGYRHLMGRIFNLVVKVLAVPGFQDTQAGFKCFRKSIALDILACQQIQGWAFDVELLFIAQKRGYQIVEVPIHWYFRENSRISPLKDAMDMFQEVVRIRRNDMRGLYDPE